MAIKKSRSTRTVVGKELKRAVGEEKVIDDEISLTTYGYDGTVAPFSKPGFVLLPHTRDDVVAVLKIADKYKIPVTTISAGVNLARLTVPSEGGIIIDFRQMNRIIEINTDSGYAVIEPGVNFDKFTGALHKKGFRFQMGTTPGGSAVLGNHLLKPSGSLSTRHLDSILDLEVVLPNGTIVNTGLSHFEGAGSSLRYGPLPDLTGLYCCSYGTLGVITKAAVKIYPINESVRVSLVGFDTFSSAVDFVKDITAHNIPEHSIIWNWTLYRAFDLSSPEQPTVDIPDEILTNDPLDPPKGSPYCIVTVFLSGYPESVDTNERVCAMVAQKYRGRLIPDKKARELLPGAMEGWEKLYRYYQPQVPIVLYGHGKSMVWIVHNEPRDVKKLEKWAIEELDRMGMRPICYYAQPFDFGRSIFYRIFVFPEAANEPLKAKVAAKFDEMYQEAMKRYNATPYRYNVQDFVRRTGGYYELLKGIKRTVDPNNILNPKLGLY